MKTKNILTFAFLGVVVGAAAYYLLATDDGKRKIQEADEGIKKLTKSIKKISKKNAKKFCEMTQNCKTEIENLENK